MCICLLRFEHHCLKQFNLSENVNGFTYVCEIEELVLEI